MLLMAIVDDDQTILCVHVVPQLLRMLLGVIQISGIMLESELAQLSISPSQPLHTLPIVSEG